MAKFCSECGAGLHGYGDDLRIDSTLGAAPASAVTGPPEGVFTLHPELRLYAERSIYVGGAGVGFAGTEACDDLRNYQWVSIGFDCWAYVGRLQLHGVDVGLLILPYGPWTAEPDGRVLVELLETTAPGTELDIFSLISVDGPRLPAHSFDVNGTLLVSPNYFEPDPDDPHSVISGATGNFTLLRWAQDEDWVDGPIIVMSSEIVNRQGPGSSVFSAEGAHPPNE